MSWALSKLDTFVFQCTPLKIPKDHQPTKWENIFVNYISKVLVSRTYRELLQLKVKKKMWVINLNRNFPKLHAKTANKQLKRCSTVLLIQKLQVKIAGRSHLYLLQWT